MKNIGKKESAKQNQELNEVILYRDLKLRGFQAAQSSSLPQVCPLECVLIALSYQTSQYSNRIKAGFHCV